MTRTERQTISKIIIKKGLRDNEAISVWYSTGYGKTKVSIDIIKDLLNSPLSFDDLTDKVVVIVPTDYLVEQWKPQCPNGVRVSTWQGLFNKELGSVKTKLLIVDESHELILTPEYSRVLKVIDAHWTIHLSGTYNQACLDWFAAKKIPIVDKILREEARLNGWVSDWEEYNVSIPMRFSDKMYLDEIEEEYRQKLLWLDPTIDDPMNSCERASFDCVKKALSSNIVGYYTKLNQLIPCTHWNQKEVLASNKSNISVIKTGKHKGKPRTKRDYVYANSVAKKRSTVENPVLPFTVIRYAKRCMQLLKMREEFFYNHPLKLEAAQKIIEKHSDRQAITFSIRSSFCDELTQALNQNQDIARSYHGKAGTKKELKKMVELFNDTSTVRVLNSVKKIKVGADFPNISLVVNCSYYSKAEGKEQQDSRATRKEGDKIALIYNLCIVNPNEKGWTIEQNWLKKAQKGKKMNWVKFKEL